MLSLVDAKIFVTWELKLFILFFFQIDVTTKRFLALNTLQTLHDFVYSKD